MGFLDFFRRSRPQAVELGGETGTLPDTVSAGVGVPGAGGPPILHTELSRLRWIASSEAVNIVRSEPDPTRWPDGQMAFELERSSAHDHAGLRDQLDNYVAARLAGEVAELHGAANRFARAREALRSIDVELVGVVRDWRRLYRFVKSDPTETGRYYRRLSRDYQAVKYIIIAIIVAIELALTRAVFEGTFAALDVPLAGLVLSLGIIVLLIVVPHFAALGIKEALASHHSFDRAAYDERDESAPLEIRRMEHKEEKDGLVFRWAALVMGVLLVVMMVPLALLRAAHVDSDLAPKWVWFLLFVTLQATISAYFFFREWLDHGPFVADLFHLTSQRQHLQDLRAEAMQDVGDALEDYRRLGEDLSFTLTEAPRWDNHIVESYYATIHYVRHIVGLENPDIRPFITWATIPYFGSNDEASESRYPLEPLSLENPTLNGDGRSRNRWRVRRVADEWRVEAEALVDDERLLGDSGGEVEWRAGESPAQILDDFLGTCFDLSLEYVRPSELGVAKIEIGSAFGFDLDEGETDGRVPKTSVDVVSVPVAPAPTFSPLIRQDDESSVD